MDILYATKDNFGDRFDISNLLDKNIFFPTNSPPAPFMRSVIDNLYIYIPRQRVLICASYKSNYKGIDRYTLDENNILIRRLSRSNNVGVVVKINSIGFNRCFKFLGRDGRIVFSVDKNFDPLKGEMCFYGKMHLSSDM